MDTEVLPMTARHREIAALLIEGNRPIEIAASLQISTRVLKAHLRTMYLQAGIRGGVKRVHLVNLLSTTAKKSTLPELTRVERRIAEAALQGMSNPQIANLCGISVQMVKNYLRSVFDKCGVWSRTELAARFRCA